MAKLLDGRWIAGGADGTIYIGAFVSFAQIQLLRLGRAESQGGGRLVWSCLELFHPVGTLLEPFRISLDLENSWGHALAGPAAAGTGRA